MMQRKASETIGEWLKSKDRKCLLVEGARQVGKTYLVEHFAENRYEELLEIDFKKTPSAKEIFSGDLDVETLVTSIRFRYPEKKVIPGKTLVFLDEIQECPEAITSLKYWALDNRYDVIASGSLLGLDYDRPSSYPVGYLDHLHLYGLDFEEFLWAKGISEEMVSLLKGYLAEKKAIPEAINSKIMHCYREYIAIGGMPEVIDKYLVGNDYREADRIQRNILEDYRNDIARYASSSEKIKAEKCYLSLGRQLLDKENSKFQYKEVEKGGRAQKFYSSIEWLLRADMVHLSRQSKKVVFDLDDYEEESSFRAYLTDLSLLLAMRDFSLKQRIVEDSLSGNTKGGIYECATADALYKRGYSLHYYKDDVIKKEVDFLIQKEGKIIPIEVKSGNNRATSLKWLMKENPDIPFAYKFIDGNIGENEGIITLPLYMAAFI